MAECAAADERASARATQAGLYEAHVNALLRLSRPYTFTNPDACITVCEQAAKVSAGRHHPLLEARMLLMAACWRIILNGWRKEDAQTAAAAMETIRRLRDVGFQHFGEILYSHVLWTQGDYTEAFKNAEDGIPRMIETQNLVVYLSALSSQSIALMHLGRWGEMLRLTRTAIATAERNGNAPWRAIFQGILAWLRTHCFDFEGSASLYQVLIRTGGNDPTGQVGTVARIAAGFTELETGRHGEALRHFEEVRNPEAHPKFFLHWYWRMIAQLGLADVSLEEGNLVKARREADGFFAAASSVADPALQALAREAQARVAMAENDWKSATQCVESALAVLKRFEVPIVAWRVQATAAELYAGAGNPEIAEKHRSRAGILILQLADSFEEGEPLRESFLGAAPVRRILGDRRTPEAKGPKSDAREQQIP
jgi:tetratricopeptide (TPR) repeat protein